MTNKCECYVTGVTEERKKLFSEVFDDGKVPIRCPVPVGLMTHKKLKEVTPFFELALERLTEDQKKRLIKQMSRKFDISEKEVEKDLAKHGCPVRWDPEVVVHWCPLHMRCAM